MSVIGGFPDRGEMTAPAHSSVVLVAGGAGYIGSHTAKLLKQASIEPVVLDNLSTGNRFALRFGSFYEGSIGDAALGLKLLRDPSLGAAWGLSEAEADFLIERYRRPQARVALAAPLRHCARAA